MEDNYYLRLARWRQMLTTDKRIGPKASAVVRIGVLLGDMTKPGRPAADHINALEWRLWQLLQCAGMKRRIASQYIEKLLGFYGLSERPWESIEQRLIKQEKSPSSL